MWRPVGWRQHGAAAGPTGISFLFLLLFFVSVENAHGKQRCHVPHEKHTTKSSLSCARCRAQHILGLSTWQSRGIR
jgi:hypothetical protein